MSRKCQLTGKKSIFGHAISHSEVKTNKKWQVNLHRKRMYLEDEDRWVIVRLSTKALKTVTRKMTLSEYCKKNNIDTSQFKDAK